MENQQQSHYQQTHEQSEDIKLRVQKLEENIHMSHFSERLKKSFKDIPVKKWLRVVCVKKTDIDTQRKMADKIYAEYGEGHFNVCFCSHKNNAFGVSFCKKAEIIITSNTLIDPLGREQKDMNSCSFQWIKYGTPTKKFKSGRKDWMFRFYWWKDKNR
jgi:hypothetical protein